MTFITFNLNSLPCMSVKLNILPPVNVFNWLLVIWDDWGFFVFAATPAEIIGVAIFNAGFKNLFHAVSDPLNIFFIVFLKPEPSSWSWFGLKVICFWHLHLGLWHISCNFKTVQFLFKSHHAELLIADRCPCVHLAFLIKSCRLVIYFVKIWRLLRPQILQKTFDKFN